jgi:hypothetical protein
MPYFKDENGCLHFLDDANFAHLLPEGCVEIADEEATALQKPTREQAIAHAWGAIKNERERHKAGGVKVGTKWYHTDTESRIQHLGLLEKARAARAAGGTDATRLQALGQDIKWKTMDGSFIYLTVKHAEDIFAAVTDLDAAAFAAAETHRVAMEASADPAAYDFSVGWPATFAG